MGALSTILWRLGHVAATVCLVFVVMQLIYPKGIGAIVGVVFFGLPAAVLYALGWVVRPGRRRPGV